MTTFRPQQSDPVRCAAKTNTLARFKFVSQIAPPNCTVLFTKHEKSCATIYQAQCKRTSWNCPFMKCKPYPLSRQGFYGLPIARRKLRGVPRDGRAMGAKHPARNPAKCLASYPRNVPAMAGQWQQQCRRASVKTTRKTACLAPDLAAHVRAGNLRDNSQLGRATAAKHLAR